MKQVALRDFQRNFCKLKREMEVEVVSHGRVVGRWTNAQCQTLHEVIAHVEMSEMVKYEDTECERCGKMKQCVFYEENWVRHRVCGKCRVRSYFKDLFPIK